MTSGAYGTTERRVVNNMSQYRKKDGSISKAAYVLKRLFPGKEHYVYCPALKRHHWLLPFYWVYRIFRMIFSEERRSYSIIAEKFEASVSLGLVNGRYKDFYDIYVLADRYDLDGMEATGRFHMRIALAQMKNIGNMQDNLNKSIEQIREAAQNNADLILFPEVQLTEFFPQYEGRDASEYRLTIDSEEIKKLQNASRECSIMTVPNIYLEENGKAYDASLFIGWDGEIKGIQKMVHVAQAYQFYEQDYYTPSDDGFQVFDTSFGKIGIVVCFDRHYPESIRTEALMGADLILIPTVNTKSEPSEMFEWELRVQAFQNSVMVAMCNRIGREGEMDFSGESIVVDANGNVIAKAGDQEQILYADIDLAESGKIRRSRPYTDLRRKEWYL